MRSSFGGGSLDAEQIVKLTDEDDEGDAQGKAADDRRGDEGNEATKTQKAYF